ncbi:MAG: N-acetylmuramoyl-L-alanine amidase [Acidobacteria bacterium]|nr:N-acetylmuramoyl-L-alanine amidase [Acidobacteriota bacterium]
MNHGRCGSGNKSAPACLILFTIISVFAVEAGQWDTAGAQHAFAEAEKEYDALKQRDAASVSEYLHCARTYRSVYTRDPHHPSSADAVYCEGLLYQKMGDLFDRQEYYHLAVKRFNFLVSDYGGNNNCSDALLRIGDICANKLNDTTKAQEAYRILKTQYGYTKIQLTKTDSTASPKKIPEQKSAEKQKENSRKGKKTTIRNIRHWSSRDYTRLVIDMDSDARYEKALLHNPKRMYFDITDATLKDGLHNRTFFIQDKFIKQVRIAQYSPDTVRIVLDFSNFKAYSVFNLQNPPRIVIDLHNHPGEQAKTTKPKPATSISPETSKPSEREFPSRQGMDSKETSREKPSKAASENKETQPLSGKKVLLSELILKDLPDTPRAAEPTSHGKQTLTRMLGLKIGRIVLDPGHGGHDLGTVGPGGLLEKDLVLSLAFKLKKMLEQKLGAEVILTRDKDIFVSLEKRTEIANQHRADLFISIHANSSRHRSISGVETYYLDFAETDSEREVAARENAGAGNSISDLENLVKQITRADKSTESKELASVIQKSLYQKARTIFSSTRNRGVRRAPFVVLIGANMPSVLTEVAFISNPTDEKLLNKEKNRDQLADALFSGIEGYMKKLGSYPIAYRTIQNK